MYLPAASCLCVCVCGCQYLHLQDRSESFSIFCNPSDVERSAENGRVVVFILDVNYHLGCVSLETQAQVRFDTPLYGELYEQDSTSVHSVRT